MISRRINATMKVVRCFSTAKKDWRSIQSFSIEDFLAQGQKKALDLDTYVDKSAKLSLIKFDNEEQRQAISSDFKSALEFTRKMDDLSKDFPESLKPLENVLEFYGGNDGKMRYEAVLKEDAHFDAESKRKRPFVVLRAYQ